MDRIQLTRRGATIALTKKQLNGLQKKFQKRHYLRFKDFLDKDLLRMISSSINRRNFKRLNDSGGSEWEMDEMPELTALLFLMSDKKLLNCLHEITHCGPLSAFLGRIYRLDSHFKDRMGWHDDWLEGRRLALSINLSRRRYQGGVLNIRNKRRPSQTRRITNFGIGNALLFRVSPDLEHSVSPVKGPSAKTALAGWFIR